MDDIIYSDPIGDALTGEQTQEIILGHWSNGEYDDSIGKFTNDLVHKSLDYAEFSIIPSWIGNGLSAANAYTIDEATAALSIKIWAALESSAPTSKIIIPLSRVTTGVGLVAGAGISLTLDIAQNPDAPGSHRMDVVFNSLTGGLVAVGAIAALPVGTSLLAAAAIGVTAAVVADFILTEYLGPAEGGGFSITKALNINGVIDDALNSVSNSFSSGTDDLADFLLAAAPSLPSIPDYVANPIIDSVSNLFGIAKTLVSPLVLDLDDNGIQTTTLQGGIHFDHNNNGFAEQSAWVGGNDGILALDRNNDGVINGGNEIFGNETSIGSNSTASNGFAALAALDTNSDGKIDSSDAQFANLKVLKANGSVWTLAQLGIQSLNLNYTNNNTTDANGNENRYQGSYTTTNSVTHQMSDIYLQTNPVSSIATSQVAVSSAVAALPNAPGYGDLPDLHQAMMKDTSGALQSLVEDFVSETDINARSSILDNILLKWAGVDGVSPDAFQSYLGTYTTQGRTVIDGRVVAFLEKFLGQDYPTDAWMGVRASTNLAQAFGQAKEFLNSELTSQTVLKPLLENVTRTLETGGQYNYAFDGVVSAISTLYSTDPNAAQQEVIELSRYIKGLGIQSQVTDFSQVQTDLAAIDPTFGTLWAADSNTLTSYYTPTELAFMRAGTTGNDTLIGTTGKDILRGDAGNDLLVGGAGDDYLFGEYNYGALIAPTPGNDTLAGGTGNDFMQGDSGDDTYLYNTGDGHDVVFEQISATGGNDKVVFGSGISFSNLIFNSDGIEDLKITFNNSPNDSLVIKGALADIEGEGLEKLVFSDGSEIVLKDYLFGDMTQGTSGNDYMVGTVTDRKIYGGAGNDTIYGYLGGVTNDTLVGGEGNDILDGFSGDDVLIGGPGNDSLEGGAGNDTYIYSYGDGYDTMNDAIGGGTLILHGVDSSDVKFEATDTTVLHIGFQDSLEYIYQVIGSSGTLGFDKIIFDDGTELSRADWEKRVVLYGTDNNDNFTGYDFGETIQLKNGDDTVNAAGGNDTVYAGNGNDNINGGSGDDSLLGEAGNDTLAGSTGNDTLVGGTGADVYLYNAGDENDTITDTNASGQLNTLVLGSDIDETDVTFTNVNGDLVATFASHPNDSIRMTGAGTTPGSVIDSLTFADGLTLSWQEINANYHMQGTANGDTLTGDANHNVLQGLAGDDSLDGGGSNDTLIGGSGADTLNGGTGNDTAYYGLESTAANIDLLNSTATGSAAGDVLISIENLTGSNYNDTLAGDNSNNLIKGGAGNDTLLGNAGADILYGNAGDDSIEGGAGNDTINGADGNDYLSGGDDNDTLTGGSGTNTLYGGAGNDLLNNTGASTAGLLNGNDGNDTLQAGSGADTLIGGTGNDSLAGGFGNNTYLFNLGDGNDTITDVIGTDTLQFGSGISTSDVWFQNSNNDILVHFTDPASGSIWVTSGAISPDNLDRYVFADNSVISYTQVASRFEVRGTSGNDNLLGSNSNETISGYAGDDTLEGGYGIDTLIGGTGNDTYVVDSTTDVIIENAGEGTDTVQSSVTYTLGSNLENLTLSGFNATSGTGNASDNVLLGNWNDNSLSGLEGNDTLNGDSGNDSLSGGTGNDSLIGDYGDDSLNGGSGNDTLAGGNGNDIYSFDTGFNHDTIDETTGSGTDKAQFLSEASSNAIFNRDANNNLLVSFTDHPDDVVTVLGQFTSTQVESFQFSDTTLSAATVNSLVGSIGNDTLSGLAGNDTLNGGDGNDTLLGGTGNDSLSGGNGDDTYQFSAGFGQDVVNEVGQTGNDALQFTDLNSANAILTADSTGDLTVSFQGSTDQVQIIDGLTTGQVENFQFADSSLTLTQALSQLQVQGTSGNDNLAGSSYNESIFGYAGNDTLNGSGGSDSLIGGTGDDQYIVVNPGATIIENANEGTDTAYVNHLQSDFTFSTSGNDFLASIGATTWLTSKDQLSSNGLDYLHFSDGTTVSIASIMNPSPPADLTLNGTGGDDFMVGGDGNDTINGNAGNDSLSGGNGNDRLDAGEGDDLVYGGAGDDSLIGYSGNDTLYGGDGNDTLEGWDGNDYLSGDAGNDTLHGDAGNDTLYGGDGNDSLDAGEGDDLAYGGSGDDTLIGYNGNDTLSGGDGNDSLDGGDGADSLSGDAGNDTLYGRTGNDTLNGGDGDDYVEGGEDNDQLFGGTGNDTLIGYSGDDTLVGGTGNDVLNGGDGNDTYLFSLGDGTDSIFDSAGTDTVSFDSSILQSTVALFKDGSNHLEIGFINSSGDQITIDNVNDIEQFQLSNGNYLTNADLNLVIQNMASYATNNSVSLTSLSDVESNANLMGIINGAWHAA